MGNAPDMLVELSKREKEAKIKPDPDLDIIMKVKKCFLGRIHGIEFSYNLHLGSD